MSVIKNPLSVIKSPLSHILEFVADPSLATVSKDFYEAQKTWDKRVRKELKMSPHQGLQKEVVKYYSSLQLHEKLRANLTEKQYEEIRKKHPPLDPARFIAMQELAQKNQDDALIALWAEIHKQFPESAGIQTHQEIREFLKNSPNVKEIRVLNLNYEKYKIKMKVLPEELLLFENWDTLLLLGHDIEHIPAKFLKNLKLLTISQNQVKKIAKTITQNRDLIVLASP